MEGFFSLGEGVAGIFLVKMYVQEIPQERLQPSDSNTLFFPGRVFIKSRCN